MLELLFAFAFGSSSFRDIVRLTIRGIVISSFKEQ